MDKPDNLRGQLQNTFENFEVSPPASIWDGIEKEIGAINPRGELSDTFNDFAVVPPTGIWDNIEKSMGIDEPRGQLHTTFYNFSVQPSIKVWAGIEQELTSGAAEETRRRRRIAWYWPTAAAIALLVLAGIALNQANKVSESSIAEQAPQPHSPVLETEKDDQSSFYNQQLIDEPNSEAVALVPNTVSRSNEIGSGSNSSKQAHTGNNNSFAHHTNNNQSSNHNHSTPRFQQTLETIPSILAEEIPTVIPRGYLAISEFPQIIIDAPETENALASNSPSLQMGTVFNQSASTVSTVNWRSSTADASLSPVVTNNYTALTESLKSSELVPGYHSPEFSSPVQYTFTAELPLSKRFSLESGLSFSNVRSTSAGISDNPLDNRELESKISYLGIPVTTRMHIVGKRKFHLSVAAGTHVQKPLSANHKQVRYKGNNDGQTISNTSYTQSGFQISALSGIDLEYRFTKRIGIRVQPQLTYYVLNHNNAYNFHTAKKLWPSIQTGLRIHL